MPAHPAAFQPYLATSLNNYANRLTALGRREEAAAAAREAADLSRNLAAERPDGFTLKSAASSETEEDVSAATDRVLGLVERNAALPGVARSDFSLQFDESVSCERAFDFLAALRNALAEAGSRLHFTQQGADD